MHDHYHGFRSFWPAVWSRSFDTFVVVWNSIRSNADLPTPAPPVMNSRMGSVWLWRPMMQTVVVHFALLTVERTHVPPMLLVCHKVRQRRDVVTLLRAGV